MHTYETNVDPAEVNRRLRNMTYGSTHSHVAAARGDEPQFLGGEAIRAS
jgi:hypothetical protein